ncbi:hypothetical protein BJX61DRAFT_520979 [Aspergillus egyptiacus]|nr:hypothetical protein BJX61DRAFT_520979 [Aspergillus egyptiacus]
MAPIAKTLAIAATAFAALGAAAPGHGHKHHHKRDEVTVWETVTTVVWTTIDITTTVQPGQPAPPSTIIEETVDEATAPPQPAPEPETTTTTTTTTSTSTSTTTSNLKKSTSTIEPEPSVETPEVQNVQPTLPISLPTVSVPTEIPVPTVPSIPSVVPEPEEPEPETPNTNPAPPSSGSGSGPCSAGSPCMGQVTFYDTATSMSAPSSCGFTNDGTAENVIALPVGIMKDSDCGRTVTVKYGGKTVKGTVVDKCMGCDNTSIDLSRHFFSLLASFAEGRLHGVEWWLD